MSTQEEVKSAKGTITRTFWPRRVLFKCEHIAVRYFPVKDSDDPTWIPPMFPLRVGKNCDKCHLPLSLDKIDGLNGLDSLQAKAHTVRTGLGTAITAITAITRLSRKPKKLDDGLGHPLLGDEDNVDDNVDADAAADAAADGDAEDWPSQPPSLIYLKQLQLRQADGGNDTCPSDPFSDSASTAPKELQEDFEQSAQAWQPKAESSKTDSTDEAASIE